jgi:hypothetical protein
MKKHREQLESVLDYIVNNEHKVAESLLHDIIVEKARDIYSELVHEDDDELEFGPDIMADPEQTNNELDALDQSIDAEEDPMGGGLEDEGDFDYNDDGTMDEHENDHEEVVDRLEDIESAIAELTAEFEEVFGSEMEDEGEGELDFGMEDEVDSEEEEDEDFEPEEDEESEEEDEDEETMKSLEEAALAEATAFLKDFAVNMKDEGQEAGKGAKVSVNDKSTHAKPKHTTMSGEPVDFAGSADEKGMKADDGSDETFEDNVDVEPKKAPEVKRKPSGEDKAAKSPLQNAPKKAK